jgi:hypothetical protein
LAAINKEAIVGKIDDFYHAGIRAGSEIWITYHPLRWITFHIGRRATVLVLVGLRTKRIYNLRQKAICKQNNQNYSDPYWRQPPQSSEHGPNGHRSIRNSGPSELLNQHVEGIIDGEQKKRSFSEN